ncbi:MAG TPA: branched-chain amino acid ABC transporter permease [Bauldia sp.]|nr:branched-chain amino acid ABC transporter permease [Bauldia sp.]
MAAYVSLTATRTSRYALVASAVVVLFLLAAPHFLPRSLTQDLLLIFLLVVMAQSWNLLAGYAGLISVGQQTFVGLGGYGLFAGAIALSLDPLVAVALSTVVVTLLAVPIGALVLRMQGAYFAVVTWVVAEVCRILLAQWMALGGGTGTSLPGSAISSTSLVRWVGEVYDVRAPAAREIIIYWIALVAMVAVIAAVYLLLRSRLGLALAAIRDGEVAAESIGVDIWRNKLIAYTIAACGTALAGALYFLSNGRISPDAGFSVLDWTAYIIFIVVIGGIGTIEGPIIGTIVFVVLRSTLSDHGPWYLILLGALGIAVMLVAPKGIWGVFSARTGIQLFPTRRRLEPVAPPSSATEA